MVGTCLLRPSDAHAGPGNQLDLSATTFFVPKNDGEAREIVAVLRKAGATDIRVSEQSWGARLDKEPPESLRNLKPTVVSVEMPSPELEQALAAQGHRVLTIDHHDYGPLKRSQTQTSIEQVAILAGQTLDRRQLGIAVNDRSYIFGLIDAGYAPEEIKAIRKYDLEAQGLTPQMLQQSEEAFAKREVHGTLTVIRTPLSRVGYISDLQTIASGNSVKDLLVISTGDDGEPKEVNFFGNPKHVKILQAQLGGWSGGDPSRSMYWGLDKNIDLHEVARIVRAPELAGIPEEQRKAMDTLLAKGDAESTADLLRNYLAKPAIASDPRAAHWVRTLIMRLQSLESNRYLARDLAGLLATPAWSTNPETSKLLDELIETHMMDGIVAHHLGEEPLRHMPDLEQKIMDLISHDSRGDGAQTEVVNFLRYQPGWADDPRAPKFLDAIIQAGNPFSCNRIVRLFREDANWAKHLTPDRAALLVSKYPIHDSFDAQSLSGLLWTHKEELGKDPRFAGWVVAVSRPRKAVGSQDENGFMACLIRDLFGKD